MTQPTTIAAAGLLCCCDDEESPCDCNCKSGDVCHGCCWGVGDLVDYEHDWTGGFTQKGTGPALAGPFQPNKKCFINTYAGGKVTVQYVYVGCLYGCDGYTDRVVYLFVPNTTPKGGGYDEIDFKECDDIGNSALWENCSSGPCVRKSISTSGCTGLASVPVTGQDSVGFQYCLPEYLGMACESSLGAGDWEWLRIRIDASDGSCEARGLIVCVNACQTCCSTAITNVNQLACSSEGDPVTGYATDDCGACDGNVTFRTGITTLACGHCVDSVSDCGGHKAYCVYRKVDQDCMFDGRLYSGFQDPPCNQAGTIECGCGCENDPCVRSSPLQHDAETCAVKACHTLVITPTSEGQTKCKWHADESLEDGGCCKKRSTAVGGSEVVIPADMPCPSIDDWSFDPCGDEGPDCSGECDCFTSPGDWVDSDPPCSCPGCTGPTLEVIEGSGAPERLVCRSNPGTCP